MSILDNFNFDPDIKFTMSEIRSAITDARYMSTVDDDKKFRWYFLSSIHWTPALEDALYSGIVECIKTTPSDKNISWWNLVINLKSQANSSIDASKRYQAALLQFYESLFKDFPHMLLGMMAIGDSFFALDFENAANDLAVAERWGLPSFKQADEEIMKLFGVSPELSRTHSLENGCGPWHDLMGNAAKKPKEGHVINPVTNQSIKIGGKTYQKLVKEKLLTLDDEEISESLILSLEDFDLIDPVEYINLSPIEIESLLPEPSADLESETYRFLGTHLTCSDEKYLERGIIESLDRRQTGRGRELLLKKRKEFQKRLMNGAYGNPRLIGSFAVKKRARLAYRTFLSRTYSPTLKTRSMVMRAFWMLRWSALRKELFARLQNLVAQKNLSSQDLDIVKVGAAGATAFKISVKSEKETNRASPKNRDMEVVGKKVKKKDQPNKRESKKRKLNSASISDGRVRLKLN